MNIGYRIVPKSGLVISVWNGPVGFLDWRSSVQRLMADPGFPATRLHLTDLRFGSVEDSIGETEMQEVIDLMWRNDKTLPGRKVAILGGDEFPRSRTYERLSEPLG